MTASEKGKIASGFPTQFEQSSIAIQISPSEFKIFEDGIFAKSMDEKWNIFVLEDILYFARSWTDACIFKVLAERRVDNVTLYSFYVNRRRDQYNSNDLRQDEILLRQLLQRFLKREDLFVDPKLELPLIKETILNVDPNNECIKSIGSNDVGVTRQIHRAMTSEEQKKYYDVTGWRELEAKIASKPDQEPLINLYLQNRMTRETVTYYFDLDASELLGRIKIERRDIVL